MQRDGHLIELLATDLVVGDIVRLQLGDRVPADLRLIEVSDLRIDESSLTGEGKPATKQTAAVDAARAAELASCTGMAFMGTLVRNGSGRGVVTGIGAHTEFGRVCHLLKVGRSVWVAIAMLQLCICSTGWRC